MSKISTATKGVGTTETTIYTCPSGKETTVSRFSVTGTQDVSAFRIKYYNSSSNNTINLIDNGSINSGDTISYISALCAVLETFVKGCNQFGNVRARCVMNK